MLNYHRYPHLLTDHGQLVEASFWRPAAFYGAIVAFYAIHFGQLSRDDEQIGRGRELPRDSKISPNP